MGDLRWRDNEETRFKDFWDCLTECFTYLTDEVTDYSWQRHVYVLWPIKPSQILFQTKHALPCQRRSVDPNCRGTSRVARTDSDLGNFEAVTSVSRSSGCSCAVFVLWQHTVSCWGTSFIGMCQYHRGCVLDSLGCLGGWFMSCGIHMNPRIWGFPAEYCTVVTWSLLLTLTISDCNMIDICTYVFRLSYIHNCLLYLSDAWIHSSHHDFWTVVIRNKMKISLH